MLTNKTDSDELYYDLPNKNIKQDPYTERDKSLILNVHTKDIIKFSDIRNFLPDRCILLLNKTTVHKVRISTEDKITGAFIEVFILKIIDDNSFECLLKSNSSKNIGTTLLVKEFEMFIESRVDNIFRLSLSNATCERLISECGRIPLPPYIQDNKHKYEYYQNEFADGGFSSASPTAGLHFTQLLLDKLESDGIDVRYILLNVGLGTFTPIRAKYIEDHKIHKEEFHIEKKIINEVINAKKNNIKVICVGTTSLRAIESAFQKTKPKLSGETDLYIKRGYEFKVADGLITNFHAPRSSLIAIIDTILGSKWKEIYRYTLESEMNFLSFGDSMYIEFDKCKI